MPSPIQYEHAETHSHKQTNKQTNKTHGHVCTHARTLAHTGHPHKKLDFTAVLQHLCERNFSRFFGHAYIVASFVCALKDKDMKSLFNHKQQLSLAYHIIFFSSCVN